MCEGWQTVTSWSISARPVRSATATRGTTKAPLALAHCPGLATVVLVPTGELDRREGDEEHG